MGGITYISQDQNFMQAFSQGLLSRFESHKPYFQPFKLFFPTNRALRLFQDQFPKYALNSADSLRQSALILPQLFSFSDISQNPIPLFGRAFYENQSLYSSSQRLMSKTRRVLILCKLLLRTNAIVSDMRSSLKLAQDLCTFIDQAYVEEIDLKQIHHIVPTEYAAHFDLIISFLQILIESWPELLKAEDSIDSSYFRNLCLKAYTNHLKSNPPQPHTPIIFTGINFGFSASLELAKLALTQPNIYIVLSGLDTQMSRKSWDMVDETHSQFLLKQFLDKMDVDRDSINSWSTLGSDTHKAKTFSCIFTPAQETESWLFMKDQQFTKQEDISHLHLYECDHLAHEVQTIALLIRHELLHLHSHQKLALVTPDRNLAVRLISLLKRWNIEVNDSAGYLFHHTEIGSYLLTVLNYLNHPYSKVSLLELLKHPLCTLGLNPEFKQKNLAYLEKNYLRSHRYQMNLPSLLAHLKSDELKTAPEEFAQFIEHLLLMLKMPEINKAQTTFKTYLSVHLDLAQKLCLCQQSHESILWKSTEAQEIQSLLKEFESHNDLFETLTDQNYEDIFTHFTEQLTFRAQHPQTPRVQILGPVESRLHHFDTVIIAGLNEDVWPGHLEVDPFMSRDMRQKLGFSRLDQKIGIMAHDFTSLLYNPKVIMTRSLNNEGTPTLPSRWLLRLKTYLALFDLRLDTQLPLPISSLDIKNIHHPTEFKKIKAPKPCPPLDARPKKLSITDIELLLRDPYQIYAKHILRLRPLAPLDPDLSAMDKGNILHKILERFFKQTASSQTPDPKAHLENIAQEECTSILGNFKLKAFWWPKFQNIFDWFLDQQVQRESQLKTKTVEKYYEYQFSDFTLTGRIDRLDQHLNNPHFFDIIDYKTGSIPSMADIKKGISLQLPLQALLILKNWHLDNTSTKFDLSYWRLTGQRQAGEIITLPGPTEDLILQAQHTILNLIAHYQKETTTYPTIPDFKIAPRYNDYALLSRLYEWYGQHA